MKRDLGMQNSLYIYVYFIYINIINKRIVGSNMIYYISTNTWHYCGSTLCEIPQYSHKIEIELALLIHERVYLGVPLTIKYKIRSLKNKCC